MVHKIKDVEIHPERQALGSLQLSPEDFYSALDQALADLDGRPTSELPSPSNIPILIHGQQHRLGDLAKIAVSLATDQRGF